MTFGHSSARIASTWFWSDVRPNQPHPRRLIYQAQSRQQNRPPSPTDAPLLPILPSTSPHPRPAAVPISSCLNRWRVLHGAGASVLMRHALLGPKPARWLCYWEGPVKRDTGFKTVLVYCVGPAEPRSYHDCCHHDGRLGPPLATLCSHSRPIGRLKQAGRTCLAKAADGRDLIMHARMRPCRRSTGIWSGHSIRSAKTHIGASAS